MGCPGIRPEHHRDIPLNNSTRVLLPLLPIIPVVVAWLAFADRDTGSWGNSTRWPRLRTEPVAAERRAPVVMFSRPSEQGAAVTADDEDGHESLDRAVAALNPADLPDYLNGLSQAELCGHLGRLLMRRWAESEPVAAGRWAEKLSNVAARTELCAAVALVWSEHDAVAALAWGQGLTVGETHDRVITDLGLEIARTEPVASLLLAGKLLPSDARDRLVLHALSQWANRDPDTAEQWSLQLPAGRLREQAVATVAIALSTQAPERGAQFAREHIQGRAELDRAVVSVVQRWAQADHARATAWVEHFPRSPLQAAARHALDDFSRDTVTRR